MAEGNRMTPGEDRVTVTMSMTKRMLLQLDLRAEQHDLHRSAYLRRLIGKDLANDNTKETS